MARVKGKQARYFHVVIKIGSTAPIKDDIIAIDVDLTNKGIEIQLKLFLAWRSLLEDTCLVIVPRKASLPYIQRMATQTLAAAAEKRGELEDASIIKIDRFNA